MASITSPQSTPSARNSTTAAAAAALRRKSRAPKSCYPCYRRKVKCDRKSPCTLCVKRGYPHLCTFDHPGKEDKKPLESPPTSQDGHPSQRKNQTMCCAPNTTATITRSGNVLVDTKEWRAVTNRLAELSQSITALRSRLELASSPPPPPSSSSTTTELSPSSEEGHSPKIAWNSRASSEEETGGVRMRNGLGGSPVHCGSGSVLAFLLERPAAAGGSIFREDSVLSQLGLENHSATYPFLDLWSSDIASYSNESVCAALPEDGICLRLLRSYRDVRMILYPVLTDFDRFEQDVQILLRSRSLGTGMIAQCGFNMAFVGMLFAVLASGCQVSDFARSERTSMCQLYVSCAYQCLRNSNFVSRPTMESVQALLIIGDTLSYEMNPGVAYVAFGLAQRMALTLGLHAESAVFKDPGAYRRQQLWWSMAWQDSHFGLSYDRPVETLSPSPQIPRPQGSRPGMRGYFETMCSVISLILQLLRDEILLGSNVNHETIPAYKHKLTKILADAAPYLQSEDYCFTLKDHIERLSLKLRSSYLVSEICRRSLKSNPIAAGSETEMTTAAPRLCHECIDSLIDTIEAYIELHEIIPHGSRSWIHLHSAISSAFLLSVDEGGQSNPNVWSILERLEKVLCALTRTSSSDNPDNGSPVSKTAWSPLGYSVGNEFFTRASPEPDTFSTLCSQTLMSPDLLPLGSELFRLDSSPMLCSPNTSPGTGPEFLTGTLTSLRKIIAGFNSRKTEPLKPKVEKSGSCLMVMIMVML
ncbi:putative transcriptional regulatory protein C3C7,04 [Talaromyces islandicus]|uniref:Putative transcriptional regulatory protein C3C7,04 n=1 Tax=Talaromyces islandicus TaxID=28573 RepID=A0A0U1M8Q6_TALIS|nr:putative transcriptional regulatory protein C3C7,04 [Talaromyces islandicus]